MLKVDKLLFSFITSIVIFSAVAIAETNITDCTEVNTSGEWNVVNNILNKNETCINITADDVILNCNYYLIDGVTTTDKNGIYSNNTDNITIQYCNLTDWGNSSQGGGVGSAGIRLDNVSNSKIEYCNVQTSHSGIQIGSDSSGITVENSEMINNSRMLISYRVTSLTISNNIIQTCSFAGITSPPTSDSSDIQIIGNTISDCPRGIGIGNFSNVLVDNNTIENNNRIYPAFGSGSTGIQFYGNSFNITISDNIIRNHSQEQLRTAISIDGSYDFTITGNELYDNVHAFHFANTVSDIRIYNNFMNNTNYFDTTTNRTLTLNTTYSNNTNIINEPAFGGNYWGKLDISGFSDLCTDSDTDGICDSSIDINNGTYTIGTDYLPLSGQYAPCVPNITLLSEVDSCLNSTNYEKNFTWTDANACGGADFSNYTYPSLGYTLSTTTYSCENSTTNKTTYLYEDDLACGYNITNSTLANCPAGDECTGAGVCQLIPSPLSGYTIFTTGIPMVIGGAFLLGLTAMVITYPPRKPEDWAKVGIGVIIIVVLIGILASSL
jgi:hypothetical protein